MGDNVDITPGVGATIAADDIGGIQHQRVKITMGPDGVSEGDVSSINPMPISAQGELIEAIEAMRMAIVSLQKSIGMAQVNPLTGRMLVDGSGVTQPVSGTVSATANQGGTWNITNLATIGGQAANSAIPAFERNTADNLRRNINVT
jgi:hypothetical protein